MTIALAIVILLAAWILGVHVGYIIGTRHTKRDTHASMRVALHAARPYVCRRCAERLKVMAHTVTQPTDARPS